MSTIKTVYIIDDDPGVCSSIRLVLSEEGFDARTYVSAQDFLAAIRPDDEGCVVSDVRMPGMNGVDLLARLTEHGPHLPVIIMTGEADVPLAVHAMKQGAVDFMEKPFASEALVASIRRALARDRRDDSAATQGIRSLLETLTAREQEVLERLVKGQPNKVIARDLGISPRTVEVHRSNVMKKTRAGSLSELVRMSLVTNNR